MSFVNRSHLISALILTALMIISSSLKAEDYSGWRIGGGYDAVYSADLQGTGRGVRFEGGYEFNRIAGITVSQSFVDGGRAGKYDHEYINTSTAAAEFGYTWSFSGFDMKLYDSIGIAYSKTDSTSNSSFYGRAGLRFIFDNGIYIDPSIAIQIVDDPTWNNWQEEAVTLSLSAGYKF
ncbi:outer membrane beta-barrel protein [Psychromonas aquimarina]|uniref:outer membrane beta-barrel protein n=1 Tax=Psychromonas aquimarina TaxID=444919 RepID=UPI00040FF19C|nr:outer membrane beta-barrel protein [Psychromonas aquimarina]